jgi:hypothetical protein
MNAKQVLDKIMIALSLVKEEVLFTYAKLADGTILESPTFDVGENADVVTEDGKSPAPAGEHEVILKDSEGNDVRIKIIVDAEGKITERENVELPEGDTEMESIAGDDILEPESPDASVLEPQDIPQTMSEVYEKLSYRIEELEKKMMDMVKEEVTDKTKPAEKVEVGENSSQMSAVKADGDDESAEDDTDEEELPKLDGAPIEDETKLSKTNYGKKSADSQSTFLSKLYK